MKIKEIRIVFREHADGQFSAEVMAGSERLHRVRADREAFASLPYDRSKPNIFNDIADEFGTKIMNEFLRFIDKE